MSPYVPPARPSIRVIRTAPYKGGSRIWGQRYFMSGADYSEAEFEILTDYLRDELKTVTLDDSSIIEYIGYNIGSDVPVFTKTVTTAGTYPSSGEPIMPLEVCALARLTTDVRTTKNHPIYGFKYFHHVQNNGGSDHEMLRTGYATTLEGIMADFLTGFDDGDSTRNWCDAKGAVFQEATVATELTHRDFPT